MIYGCVYPEKFEGDKAVKLMQVIDLHLGPFIPLSTYMGVCARVFLPVFCANACSCIGYVLIWHMETHFCKHTFMFHDICLITDIATFNVQ